MMKNNYSFPYAGIGVGEACLRVNLHTHAGVCKPGKCGILPLEDVSAAYAAARYDTIAISNHDMYLPREDDYALPLLDAVEYSATPHMLQIGIREFRELPHQAAIDFTRENGGFVILCHPNWGVPGYRCAEYDALLETLDGYTGIEIINPVIYRLSGSGLALDTWDSLLTRGKRVFGFGNDDFHLWQDTARAWNMIYAKSTDYADIREAVEAGRFYVSTGLALKECTLTDGVLRITAGWFTESYVKEFRYKLTGENGRLLAEIDADSAEFVLPEGESYVRVEVTGENGAKLYLQPIFRN